MRLGKYVVLAAFVAIALGQFSDTGWTQETSDRLDSTPVAREHVSAQQCKFCHNKAHEGEQYSVWKSLGHSNAYETLFEKRALKFAEERGLDVPPSESADCLKCHVTGYDEATASYPPQLDIEDGVQCGSCHGPASAHLQDGKALRINKDATIDLKANLIEANEALCRTCHNPESPPWNPQKFTLESGETVGFDFEQAMAVISHLNPNRVRDE